MFSKTVLQLYIHCGASPGSQQLEHFKKATLNFNGDCAEFAAQQQEWIRLAWEQTPEEQATCSIPFDSGSRHTNCFRHPTEQCGTCNAHIVH